MSKNYPIIGYKLFCYIDGKYISKDKRICKFKKGDFLKADGNPTKDIYEAEIYKDYSILDDGYDDYCMADLFWAVEVKADGSSDTAISFYSPLITKSGKEEVVKLDFTLFNILKVKVGQNVNSQKNL